MKLQKNISILPELIACYVKKVARAIYPANITWRLFPTFGIISQNIEGVYL